MSIRKEPGGLRTYLLESNSQQQGEIVKTCMRELQRAVSRVQRDYSQTGVDLFKSECKKTEESINILKNLKPQTKREQMERQALVDTYSKQFSRLLESMHKFNESQTTNQNMQQQAQLQAQVYDEDILRDRQIELGKIEECLQEVNDMMKYCAETVQEQGVVLDRIEDHVDDASENSGQAVLELNKAEEYQKKSHGNCKKILFLLAAILLVFFLLMYTYS